MTNTASYSHEVSQCNIIASLMKKVLNSMRNPKLVHIPVINLTALVRIPFPCIRYLSPSNRPVWIRGKIGIRQQPFLSKKQCQDLRSTIFTLFFVMYLYITYDAWQGLRSSLQAKVRALDYLKSVFLLENKKSVRIVNFFSRHVHV